MDLTSLSQIVYELEKKIKGLKAELIFETKTSMRKGVDVVTCE